MSVDIILVNPPVSLAGFQVKIINANIQSMWKDIRKEVRKNHILNYLLH